MRDSPFTPGAGLKPPVLAGRDALLEEWRLALADVDAVGRARAPEIILTGPRGVGKTVAVNALAELGAEQGFEVIELQTTAGNATLVESLLTIARTRLEAGSGPWERARRAFERLGGVSLSVAGTGGSLTVNPATQPQPGVSPEGLAEALGNLSDEIRQDAPHGGLMITIDELQVAEASDLTLLAGALQTLNRQRSSARVIFAATGLPNTFDVLDKAGVTHPDRLFDFREIELLLAEQDARYAIVEPARLRSVTWDPEAAALIVQITRGYPAHLQLFAHRVWSNAQGPDRITLAETQAAIPAAAAEVERRNLAPRFDRHTPRELEFLTALAVAGSQARIATIAALLGREQKALSRVQDQLLEAGAIFRPRRGEVALAVPLFAPYLLANYEELRLRATVSLVPLADMYKTAGYTFPPEMTPGADLTGLYARDDSTTHARRQLPPTDRGVGR